MSLPGVKIKAIHQTEKILGIQFPEDYKNLLLTQNRLTIGEWEFYPIKDEAFMKKTWDDIVRNNQELDESVPEGFIAIASNGTYNQIGYMYGKGYQVGAIYYWNHETDALLFESPLLSEWISEMNKTGEDRFAQFVEEVQSTEALYGLIDSAEGGMAYAMSNENGDTDVMLFWSSQTLANACKEEEWSDYKILEISLQEFLQRWVPGMHKDGVLCGLNWGRDLTGEELDPMNLGSLLKK